VPDARPDALAELSASAKITPTYLEFVDIAGLVKGASSGEGLGNKFLANIREVDAILHVLRCFDDADVSHVSGAVDPVADAETVETELMLADLESLERRLDPLTKKARGNDADAKADLKVVEKVLAVLTEGGAAREAAPQGEERRRFRALNLLTAKPVLYVCNVDEEDAGPGNALSEKVAEFAARTGAGSIVISARIEAEIAQLSDEAERTEFLAALGLAETGLDRLIRAGYGLLGLITYFTTGPKETRAWTIPDGTRAAPAAGRIHTDFERGFICAETIAYADFIACGGEQGAKEAGKMRQEGRDYLVKDGDVILYRFNV
jgi:GTP-binding protein YchF